MKKLFSALVIFMAMCTVNALPGISSYIPDSDGEYIFYSDASFKDESYIGFICYSNDTYGLRYYSPAAEDYSRMERDITLYITINPLNQFLEFTGERIVGAVSQEDTEIVNYLHDLFYEFTSRRRKIKPALLTEPYSEKQDFSQFGGKVTVSYNPLIPIFNMQSISAPDGKIIFNLAATGILSDSKDKSFTDFKGIKSSTKGKSRSFNLPKKTDTREFTAGTQTLKLDTAWEHSLENLWFLGDYALITVTEMQIPKEIEGREQAFYLDTITRKFSQSTDSSYNLWQYFSAEKKKNSVKVSNVFLDPNLMNITRDFKIITAKKDGKIACLSLTVFDDVYRQNKKYFDAILKSYKAE